MHTNAPNRALKRITHWWFFCSSSRKRNGELLRGNRQKIEIKRRSEWKSERDERRENRSSERGFWSSSKRQHVEVVAVPSYDMCCVLQLFYFSLDVVDVASPLPLSPSYSTFYACLSKACKLSFSCPVFLFKSTSFCYMCHWRPPSQYTMFEKLLQTKIYVCPNFGNAILPCLPSSIT